MLHTNYNSPQEVFSQRTRAKLFSAEEDFLYLFIIDLLEIYGSVVSTLRYLPPLPFPCFFYFFFFLSNQELLLQY